MENLNVFQLLITAIGTLIVPVLALYIRAQFYRFELQLNDKLQEFRKEAYDRTMESQEIHSALSQRIAVVENGHKSISDRQDSVQRELHNVANELARVAKELARRQTQDDNSRRNH